MLKTILFSFSILGLCIGINAQVDKNLIQSYLTELSENSELSLEDVSNWEITDSHIDTRNGIQFVYIRQTINDIPVQNGLANFAIKNGRVAHMASRLISELTQKLPSSSPSLSPELAITNAASLLNMPSPSNLNLLKKESEHQYLYSNGDISLENIPVKLMYVKTDDGNIHLAWNLSFYELSAENWWSVSLDANTGELLNKVNWVTHCEFGDPHFENESIDNNVNSNLNVQEGSIQSSAGYRVFEIPTESPNHGPHVLVSDPFDTVASPFEWHDIDGIPGPEYTITRGNNVHAYEDANNTNTPGFSPDGTAALIFDFPFSPGTPPSTYQSAAITNLFYANNIMHDIWYRYGFDEASGNFQVNNYGNGGIGGDDVRAEAQDGGGTNNANFATPSDGNRPRMQMYLWGSGNSARDGDFDNGIVAHEYGHGISNRLTGGASNVGCLSNQEQMGEGWSDWFGLMITMDSSDQGPDKRGIGTFAINQSTNGTGIRPAPYSTSFTQNNFTYGRTNNTSLSAPHGIGFVFATALWDLNWALINQYGGSPDPDLYNGTGGNNIAMNLVTTGLKLQPCNPGMIDGRDAILKADSLLYNGIHQCLIWDAFANRGFGFWASQGSNDSRTDQIEDFTNNPLCLTATLAPIANFGTDQTNPICGENLTFIDSSLNLAQQWFWDFGDGSTSSLPRPKHKYPGPGTYSAKLVVSNNIGSDSITKTITIGGPNPPTVMDQEKCNGGNVLLVATNQLGTPEWFDVNNNLVATGLIYLVTNVNSDQEFYVRNVPNGTDSSCVSVFDTASITVIKSDFSYNQVGPTVNFIDSSANATSWTWSFGDGNTSTLQNPSHNYAAAGNYNVRLAINGTPCSKTETISVISSLAESFTESIEVFPNPAKDYITIKLNKPAKSEIVGRIESIHGSVLEEFKIPAGEQFYELDVYKYSSSMYLMRLMDSNSQFVHKILLEK